MKLRPGKLALVTLMILDTIASLGHVLKLHDPEMDRLIRIPNSLSLAIIIVTPTLRITTARIPTCVLVEVSFPIAMFRILGLNRKCHRTALRSYPSCLSVAVLVL
jgi:hypothetical protein